jgi:putative SOS response-associated peptidase YedK
MAEKSRLVLRCLRENYCGTSAMSLTAAADLRTWGRTIYAWVMCNLYTTKATAAEIAAAFGAQLPMNFNTPEESYPGTPGMVVHEDDGRRIMQSMTWGFPLRLKGMSPTAKPKPVNNIADLRKPMWVGLARKPEWRCLIPLTAFAEAEGPKGSKTRTWFNVKGEPIFAWAGLWRVSAEWGPVYSGVMTDCNEAIRPVHNRMPVLLMPDEYDRWLHGEFEEAVSFQERCFPDELIVMTRTEELWVKRKSLAEGPAGLL